jgi:hypothetical protein
MVSKAEQMGVDAVLGVNVDYQFIQLGQGGSMLIVSLSDREAGYFTNVDGTNRFALVALDPERPEEIIGVVSFDREGDTERAEYAAEVEDRWQGRGLGMAGGPEGAWL